MDGLLFDSFIYLTAAIIAVPIAKRLGLGSVLGYLIAGIVIGPVIGLVGSETRDIQHFAEFGVVMMLFLVGLELEPRLLWQMRTRLLGLGGLQVLLTTLVIFAIGLGLGLGWTVALTVGLIFSLSSTAIVLQTLGEKGLTHSEGGRSSFSVLLFQDIAVIPMLALIPLLVLPELLPGTDAIASDAGHVQTSLVAQLPGWLHALVVLGAVAAVLLGGHYLSRPVFRFIAASRLREIFTATALVLIIGIALLMTLVDLSPALGTFLAGVVLANSEFKHELESDIEPFKGLLLGLFFITVGAGIDFEVLAQHLGLILGLTLGLMVLKALVLLLVARLFHLRGNSQWLFALGLAQAGEFGFVLLNFSVQNHVLPYDLSQILSLLVALSMLLTPLLFIFYDKVIIPRLSGNVGQEADEIDDQGVVVIAGLGRFGQIVNRLLVASGVKTVVLDYSYAQVESLRKANVVSFYGDASRPDLLHSAGIKQARLFVVAIDDVERATEMVKTVRQHNPRITILARAFDVRHLYHLKKAGADIVLRELFDTSLQLGKLALREMGMHPYKVEKMAKAFRQHDEDGMNQLYAVWDQDMDLDFGSNRAFLQKFIEHSERLKDILQNDRSYLHDRTERGWTPPPKND